MTNEEAKKIFKRFLDGEKITRGELVDAVHVASVEAMKSDPDDKKLVSIFEKFSEKINELYKKGRNTE